jgi:hypothetical protein
MDERGNAKGSGYEVNTRCDQQSCVCVGGGGDSPHTVPAAPTELALRVRVALLCGFHQPLDRLVDVCFHAPAVVQAPSKLALSVSLTLLCSFCEVRDRGGFILRHASAVKEANAQRVLSSAVPSISSAYKHFDFSCAQTEIDKGGR